MALHLGVGGREFELLRDGLGRGGRCRHADLLGVAQELLGELLNLRRHGCREEQRLARGRQKLADALDIGDEAHVEHAVRLVDDEVIDRAHKQFAAPEMIEQAAGRRDQDVGAAFELALLVIEGDAANE